MLRDLAAFVPVAALLTLAPGPATALVVRSAVVGGRRGALLTTLGNSVGVLAWGVFAAVGIAAVVATSAHAFTVVKLAGAVALIVLGLQSLWRGRRLPAAPRRTTTDTPPLAGPARIPAVRDGLVTSLANPKLAVFYVALFPQFVAAGGPVLPSALAMAALVVSFDLVWYSLLAYVVARARRAFVEGPWLRRAERLTARCWSGWACGSRSSAADSHHRAQPLDEGGHGRGVAARCLGPLVDAIPPILARRTRIARDQVEVEVLHGVADHRGVHVLGPLARLQRATGARRVPPDRRRLGVGEIAELGDVAPRLDEQVAEVDPLGGAGRSDERQVRDDRVLVGQHDKWRQRRVGVLVADEAVAHGAAQSVVRPSSEPHHTSHSPPSGSHANMCSCRSKAPRTPVSGAR
jgi:threonine/homoserine/homoserine lactone efflux protein